MQPVLITIYFVAGTIVCVLLYLSSRGYEDREDIRDSWGCLLFLGVPELALLAIALWPVYLLFWSARKLSARIMEE